MPADNASIEEPEIIRLVQQRKPVSKQVSNKTQSRKSRKSGSRENSTVGSAKSKKTKPKVTEKKAPPVVVDFTKAEGPPSIRGSAKQRKAPNR
jgi:dihydrodipicolinate reductase